VSETRRWAFILNDLMFFAVQNVVFANFIVKNQYGIFGIFGRAKIVRIEDSCFVGIKSNHTLLLHRKISENTRYRYDWVV
jgi:hypothetical protein